MDKKSDKETNQGAATKGHQFRAPTKWHHRRGTIVGKSGSHLGWEEGNTTAAGRLTAVDRSGNHRCGRKDNVENKSAKGVI